MLLLGLCFFAGLPNAAADPHPLAQRTIVIYNRNSESGESLARYYQEKRGIPSDNIIGLDAPTSEEISRDQFETRISAPLRAILMERDLWRARGSDVTGSRIRYAAVIRGMPLKIRTALPPPTQGEKRHPVNDRDEASVDSELSVLGLGLPEKGAVNNPFFRSLSRAVDAPIPAGVLLVSRLDAASDETVRRMIDDALEAERRGLWGWAYIDARGIQSGPYAEGDRWLLNARDTMRRRGIPVLAENTEPTLPSGFPVQMASIYYGWYARSANGPFVDDTARFVPGAVAVHIHSFSASTLRSKTVGWAAPLLERGAAVTAGNVYEPYLGMSLYLDIFQDRLMNGLNVAEAGFAATPALSWQGILLGDPLYRPYARWHEPELGSQRQKNEWEQFRDIVIDKNGNWNVAAPFLLELGKRLNNPMPAEAVASWRTDEGQTQRAIETFEQARKLAVIPWQRAQIDWLLVRTLSHAGKKNEALQAASRAYSSDLSEPEQQLFIRESNRLRSQ